MAGFRITHRTTGIRTMEGLQQNLGRMGTLQQQLSSGKQLTRASDSPTGAVSALRLRSEVRTLEQYSRNANDGLGWLGTIDKTLFDVDDNLQKVRELTVYAMNDPSAGGRPAVAMQVGKIREHLLSVANTRYLDRPVFGGTTTATTAYDATGAHTGDTNPVVRRVGDDALVQVDTAGPAVWGATPATSVFSIVQDIANDMTANPGALAVHLDRLDAAMKVVQEQHASVGARYNRVEQMKQLAEDRVIGLKASLSEVEDIDLPKTIVDLQMQETAYRAALGATQRVIQPSLVDFLL